MTSDSQVAPAVAERHRVAITAGVNLATGSGPAMAGFFAAANLARAYGLVWLLRRWSPELWAPGGPTRLPELWRFLPVAA